MSKPHICAINWEILGNIRQFAILFAYLNFILVHSKMNSNSQHNFELFLFMHLLYKVLQR